ncbi:MAG: sigma factor-like helix-turn-helix DNA-binding protein [Candidatus Paceibacterota bacterium]
MNKSPQEAAPRKVVEYHQYLKAVQLYVEDFGVSALKDLVEDTRDVLAGIDREKTRIKREIWKETKQTLVYQLATHGTVSVISLDTPAYGGDDDVSLAELVPSDARSPHVSVLHKEMAALVNITLEKGDFKKRERLVLRMRYGIGCEEQTLEIIGALFGITRERVRQIEVKALKKAKRVLASYKVYVEHVL